MNFKKWVKSIQAAAYNGARTVIKEKSSAFIYLLFKLIVEARAEILKKIIGILVKTMTPKGHFEIN